MLFNSWLSDDLFSIINLGHSNNVKKVIKQNKGKRLRTFSVKFIKSLFKEVLHINSLQQYR